MKAILFILALFLSDVAISQTASAKTTFIITKTTPYCGGANPPEQFVKEARKKKIPYGEKFYVIKGSRNNKGRIIIDSFVIGSSGKWVTFLKPGCYSVIDIFGYNKIIADPNLYDIECLNKLREEPLFKFELMRKKSVTFSFNISEACPYTKPCYKGKIALPM